MREPDAPTPPTISGLGVPWQTDAAFSSVINNNRRHLSLFRLPLATTAPEGTQITITAPDVQSSGAVVFVLPGPLAPASAEPPATGEGSGPFSETTTTTASGTLCGVVHHNGASATFGPEWQPFVDLTSNCGEARQTAGLHLRVGPGGNVDCSGALSNDSFSWITVVLGYDGLP